MRGDKFHELPLAAALGLNFQILYFRLKDLWLQALARSIILGLPKFAWMAGIIFGLARATCSAKYMIRVNWSLAGGLRTALSPTQAKGFQVARCYTPVAQMSIASQVTLT